MAALALGGLALACGLWLLHAFTRARAETVRKALIWLGGALAALLLLALLVTGRGMQAIWFAGLAAPLAWRWWQGGRFAGWFGRRGSGATTGGGAESRVETATLSMRLDHASGEMSGRVRQGGFAGRELAELGPPQLLALLAECRAGDPESLPLLEAWLDRAWPEWRAAEAAQAPPAAGPMDRAQALAILGLAEGASVADIRAAHRRLMQAAHPDHGGSDWLAAQVNQARDILLR